MHLEGRTFGEIVLDPYDWSVQQDQDEFRVVLHMLDKSLDMEVLAGLGQMDTAIRVCSTPVAGLGQAATLAERGRAIALRAGRPKITHDLLAEAVDELRIGVDRRKVNPFRVASVDQVQPAAPSTTGIPLRVGVSLARRRHAADRRRRMTIVGIPPQEGSASVASLYCGIRRDACMPSRRRRSQRSARRMTAWSCCCLAAG